MSEAFISFEWIGNCTEINCDNKASMVCELHRQNLCSNCVGSFHSCCEIKDIGNTEAVEAISKSIKWLLNRMSRYGEDYNLDAKYPGYNDNLKVLIKYFDDFRKEIKDVEQNLEVLKIRALKKRVIEIKAKVDTSFCFTVLSTFTIHLQESLEMRRVKEKNVKYLLEISNKTDTSRV